MAPDPTLRLTVSSALKAGVDGAFEPIVMATIHRFSQPYEQNHGPQRRCRLLDRLQRSGWQAGTTDVSDEGTPHSWSATWDADRTLRLAHKSITTPFVSAVITSPDRDHTDLWWRIARSSAWITALLITNLEPSQEWEDAAMQSIADGQFLYIAMPLVRA
jgi:hypothetical protein